MHYLASYVRNLASFRLFFLLGVYTVISFCSLWLAYQIRFDFSVPHEFLAEFIPILLWVIPLKLAVLFAFRQFDSLLGYFSVPDIQRLFLAVAVASLIIGVVRLIGGVDVAPPRGVILADFVLFLISLSGTRLAFRIVRERYLQPELGNAESFKRVGIIGAGDVGASLAKELFSKRGLGLLPVAFFDDNQKKWRSRIHGVPVLGPPQLILQKEKKCILDEVIIAMPKAPAKRIAEVVKMLQKARIKFETVPSMDQLATGQVRVSQLRPVEIQDLLNRDSVELGTRNIQELVRGKVVMVTGAGGSIGSELCRQIAICAPRRLLLVEQSEVQMYQIEQELIEKGYGGMILPLVADILDEPRMRYIFNRFHPQQVFHAAAHKHVPMMESQPGEAFKNNTLGTAQVAELSAEYGADRFVLISTDKAINPTNAMGVSKRLAEVFIQSLGAKNGGHTKFMAVRFGNVLGSSGSVVPSFKKQIAAGGPVKVTHPDVTRYFMTIPEAVGLVLQSATLGKGGDIFVLDMGQPIKIVELARQLIELSGLRPDEDIEIQFIGLRPGEKLYEELGHDLENLQPTEHPKIMSFICEPLPIEDIRILLDNLSSKVHTVEPNELKRILKEAIPEYQPFLT
ncbi:MAG: nucleoside-diphosphate sugar epimerase/dehydratase [Opitutales bacterium]